MILQHIGSYKYASESVLVTLTPAFQNWTRREEAEKRQQKLKPKPHCEGAFGGRSPWNLLPIPSTLHLGSHLAAPATRASLPALRLAKNSRTSRPLHLPFPPPGILFHVSLLPISLHPSNCWNVTSQKGLWLHWLKTAYCHLNQLSFSLLWDRLNISLTQWTVSFRRVDLLVDNTSHTLPYFSYMYQVEKYHRCQGWR